MAAEPDDTIRLRAPRRAIRGRLWPWLLGAGCGAALAAAGLWWSLEPEPARLAAAQAAETPDDEAKPDRLRATGRTQLAFVQPTLPSAQYAPPLASEAEILRDSPSELAVYRFASQPNVVVLQFPSLSEQALTLNRVAALLEKSGYPREQVLPRAEIDARIVAGGATPDDFYYGHDYRSADLLRFFRLATDLNAQEQGLLRLTEKLGWGEPGAAGALVTLVRQSAGNASLDANGRAAILRHELSHGVYFTTPDYAAYCEHFWHDTLTPDERDKFAAFLGREGYDTALPDLVTNEMQAYLMHTPDRRFFSPAELGIPQQRVAELRQVFLVGMPPSWLRDLTTADKLP